MDDRYEEKIWNADSEMWDWEILMKFGEYGNVLSAVTIDVAKSRE